MSRKRSTIIAVSCAVAAALLTTAVPASGHDTVRSVTARTETPPVFADTGGDADDPAIWLNRADPDASLVIVAAKKAGLRVYRTDGTLVQAVPAGARPGSAAGRLNNVDIVTGMRIAGHRADLVIASDRGSDQVRSYLIRPDRPDAPLAEVTADGVPPVFAADQSGVDGDTTAYGLTAWQHHGHAYALLTRAGRDQLALVELSATPAGTVGYRTVRTLRLPDTFALPDGTNWAPCENPGEQPQAEGLVVDPRRGVLYAAQEDVGIWRLPADLSGPGTLIDRVRDYGVPAHYDAPSDDCVVDGPDPGFGGTHLTADVEGLTIAGHQLIASSQGDDTFARYSLGATNAYRGAFRVADGAVDGSQHCDGLDAYDGALGSAFPHGLLAIQDGTDTGPDTAGREATNVKFVDRAQLRTAR
jgi:3-phytase